MLNIPNFYEATPTFDEAVKTITSFGGGLLEGMEKMQNIWNEYAESSYTDEPMFEDDDAFFSHFEYEANAFNVVFSRMQPLFIGK